MAGLNPAMTEMKNEAGLTVIASEAKQSSPVPAA
jgi:hypothetical protein